MTPEVSPQQILDEQGYLIFAARTRGQIGDVVEGLSQQDTKSASSRHAIPGPAVIIGIATLDEFQQQANRFWGGSATIPPGWDYFYKAVAE